MASAGLSARLKSALHRWLDPALSWPDARRAGRVLAGLPDGEYTAGVKVPYYSQFPSPELVNDYIHHGYDGLQDPNWAVFGTNEPAEAAFWAPRVCALAVIKMAVEAFHPLVRPTLWQLVKEGLTVNGYTVRDVNGNWVDQGWYVAAQMHLAELFGLEPVGQGYASPLSVCRYIYEGWLVAASVTPEIGERQPLSQRYGGHVVLVYGFEWRDGRPVRYLLHNPSGRYPELRAGAWITADRFKASFAHRLIALRPAPLPEVSAATNE